ncbi:MAG: PilZ domain-containing protein [Pseudomonadota bacterium]
MGEEAENAGKGLTYSDNMAIAWQPVTHGLDQTHLARVNASNEDFLRAVAVIGDGGSPTELQDSNNQLAQEVGRIDLKLNLLMDLVATLIYNQLDIPDTTPVRVSASGVAWHGQVPNPGSTVYLQLYIKRGLPKPLCCYGKVVSTEEEFAAATARVSFIGLTGAARSWLEKLIFRHHRREVAFMRSAED